MSSILRSCLVALALVVSACGAPAPEDAVDEAQEELRATCASLTCAPSSTCVQTPRGAVCVPRQPCRSAADCRLSSNYCASCACDVLGPGDPLPACEGSVVACLVDPCDGKAPVCKRGQCELARRADTN